MIDEVTQYITALPQEWQQEVCQELRKLVHEADPDIVESIKWKSPFFEHSGQVCSIAAAKNFVRFIFMRGADLPPSLLFGQSNAKQLRTIKIREGQMVPAQEIIGLLREAIKLNTSR